MKRLSIVAVLLNLTLFPYLTVFPCLTAAVVSADEQAEWNAGVATADITPGNSMWMAGYASRRKPSEGTAQKLFAKALAIQDRSGNRLVIMTTDLIGIPRELREWMQAEVERNYGLPPQSLLLNASHTHCGPELRISKATLYGVDEDRIRQSLQYADELKQKLLKLTGDALQNLQPAVLGYTHGRAAFAMNRRLPTDTEPRNAPYPDGPVDHDVPVLKVDTAEGRTIALLFGYACHNTTLGFFQFCGDYAGFAQQDLETSFPGVTAMFITGCGGDQNPQPRGTLELAEHHGSALATGVKAGLLGPIRPLSGPLKLAFSTVELEFAAPPTRAELLALTKSTNPILQRRGESLLSQLDEKGTIDTTYPYLIQVVEFGDDLLMVALAGEVVVDYSIRLKRELRDQSKAVWISGYSNDVFGYVPSLRVLQEGGYEGRGAMQYTSLPGPFAPSVEERIVGGVHEMVQQLHAE